MNKNIGIEAFRPHPSEETIKQAFNKIETEYQLAQEKGDTEQMAKAQKALDNMLTELRMSSPLVETSVFEQRFKEMAELQTLMNHSRLNNQQKGN